MPKKVFKIHSFHDGLINDPSPRDIPETASPVNEDIDGSSLGKLGFLGKFTKATLPDNGISMCNRGIGFHLVGSDYKGLDEDPPELVNEKCFIYIAGDQDGDIKVLVRDVADPIVTSGSGWEPIIEFDTEF